MRGGAKTTKQSGTEKCLLWFLLAFILLYLMMDSPGCSFLDCALLSGCQEEMRGENKSYRIPDTKKIEEEKRTCER